MLRLCSSCDRYTMQEACPRCGAGTEDPRPAKFSPDEKHGAYRRRLKRLNEEKAAEAGE